MKKPIALRILLFLLLYAGIFTVISMIQFNEQGGFSREVGDFVVSGQYLEREETAPVPENGEYLLSGKASIFFGGMEFCLGWAAEESVLRSVDAGGNTAEILPVSLRVSGNSAVFRLSGGQELVFSSHYTDGADELRVSCAFPGEEAGGALELPFRPMRKTGTRALGGGQFIITYDGANYSFGDSPMDASRRLLFLFSENPSLSYRAVPDSGSFNPADFVLSRAESIRDYSDALALWLEQSFAQWNRTVAQQNDEDLVIALAAESINRGIYRTAVSAVPQVFLDGDKRSYRSSVYLGRLDRAYQSLIETEQREHSNLSHLMTEKSLDFFLPPHVLEFFAARGYGNFLDDGAELIRSIDPDDISLELCPGILEASSDWKTLRPLAENPFENLIDQVCFVVSKNLRTINTGNAGAGAEKTGVFVSSENQVNIEFNIRLAKALLAWAQNAGEESWAALARSIMLSALPPAGESARNVFDITGEGGIAEDASSPVLTPAGIYRILRTGANYPHAVNIGAAAGIWVWTAASGVSVARENNVTDISVNFPAGETHYMIIRGIRPFQKIQLYGVDFRTDPQFERYDSSGWSYVAADQTLLVKMKHRAAAEHIRIYY